MENRPLRVVHFGCVTVVGREPTPEQRARNSRESQEALIRLRDGLATPGVRLVRKPGVPYVWANKHRPGTVIRELDGRQEVGTLQPDGTWLPLAGEPDQG